MDERWRAAFDAAGSSELADTYRARMERAVGPFPFRLAETPFFLSDSLRDRLAGAASEIALQLAAKERRAEQLAAVPARYLVPGMTELPDFVQVDFAVVRDDAGGFDGRVVELQAFPSLTALHLLEAETWLTAWNERGGPPEPLRCVFSGSHARAVARLRDVVLGGEDPMDVALVDVDPPSQKTRPDFDATTLYTGVTPVCVTQLQLRGRELWREVGGRMRRVTRLYNRLVFDEIERKGIVVPFDWNADLDVTWCSHPNWYWAWSKHSLPGLIHRTMPETHRLDALAALPNDLDDWVLKPLFSYAGTGVVLHPTSNDVEAIPAHQRGDWVLQRRIRYATVLRAPDGGEVRAEVRVMLSRNERGDALEPVLPIVRLSRGAMLGVDHNRASEALYTGGTVGLFRAV